MRDIVGVRGEEAAGLTVLFHRLANREDTVLHDSVPTVWRSGPGYVSVSTAHLPGPRVLT